jgi:hypothetical protein
MYTIYAVLFSVAHNISMTITVPDQFDSYFECLYWGSAYQSAINDQSGPVEVRAWECRKE